MKTKTSIIFQLQINDFGQEVMKQLTPSIQEDYLVARIRNSTASIKSNP